VKFFLVTKKDIIFFSEASTCWIRREVPLDGDAYKNWRKIFGLDKNNFKIDKWNGQAAEGLEEISNLECEEVRTMTEEEANKCEEIFEQQFK
jgi:hypothetical protein